MTEVAKTNDLIKITPGDVGGQIAAIQELMSTAMKDGEHYGVIPGTNKPSLYKAGAEKLSLMFRLAPKYQIDKSELANYHVEYDVVCSLYHIESGKFFGEGVGNCSTLESKYRYRNSSLTCPECGKETVIKGKKEYGGGYLCFAKKGGCGAKYKDDAPEIINQSIGKVENPDIADQRNTVKKMAKKRAFVDAMLTATAASDIFTQDIEDFMHVQEAEVVPDKKQNAPEVKKNAPKKEITQDDIHSEPKKVDETVARNNAMLQNAKDLKELSTVYNGFGKDKSKYFDEMNVCMEELFAPRIKEIELKNFLDDKPDEVVEGIEKDLEKIKKLDCAERIKDSLNRRFKTIGSTYTFEFLPF